MARKQIIALGGGGFSMEPHDLTLDRYILEQVGVERPKVCFLGQASAESPIYVTRFYDAYTKLDARPSWFSVFGSVTNDWRDFLLDQDMIFVGGGNTRSMLALWREWQIDDALREAYENGVVLAGISAGAICWFEQGVTDSVWPLGVMPCLGLLPGSACPHYDGESDRRPAYTRMVKEGMAMAGLALDDSAAAHFVDGELKQIVTASQQARGYRVEKIGGEAVETSLDRVYLGS